MLSLKVRFIPYSNYIQRTKRSNYAASSRLQEYENNGNSETVKQKSGCGRFREVVVFERLQLQWFCWENFGVVDKWLLMGGGRTWKVDCKKMNYTLRALSKNQNWIAGPWPDQSFWQAISFIRGFSQKSLLLRARYLWFDWCGWIVLIKSEILITTWMVWPSSSGKWKAPLN